MDPTHTNILENEKKNEYVFDHPNQMETHYSICRDLKKWNKLSHNKFTT